MENDIIDFRPVRFSTAAIPERDRIPVWRDFFGPSVFHTEIEPASGVPFHADVRLRRLPGVCLVSNVMSPARFSRTRALAADGNDDIGLVVASSGGTASQRGRELTFRAGDAFLMDAGRAGDFVSPPNTQFHCFHLHVPRAGLAHDIAQNDLSLQPIPPDTEALRYLLRYVDLFRDDSEFHDAELARTAAMHLRDLVSLALGATRDAAFIAESRGLRAARLRAIKDHIVRNSRHHGLALQSIAALYRLTPRYVQRLFEADGTTFTDFLLEQRLLHAHRMLADPRYRGWIVSALALEAGFGDISYFNRCFRRRFGMSPTEARVACREH